MQINLDKALDQMTEGLLPNAKSKPAICNDISK